MLPSIPKKYRTVAEEVIQAYKDANDLCRYGDRNLNFRAFRTVPAAVAAKIMVLACPQGYNEFNAYLLGKIKGQVLLAREYSPCVYVSPNAVAEHKLSEDEYNVMDGKLRIWWD